MGIRTLLQHAQGRLVVANIEIDFMALSDRQHNMILNATQCEGQAKCGAHKWKQ